MNLLEIQQAGPGADIQGGILVFVQAFDKVINGAHAKITVRDDSGVTLPAMVFGTTAIQAGSWYQAQQRMNAGQGPAIRFQQKGTYPASLAIDGSVFQLFPGRQGPPAAGAAMPAAASPGFGSAPVGAPAAGRLTDEVLLRSLARWLKYLDGSVPNLHQDTMTAILQSLIVGVREGSVALAPAQGSQPAGPPGAAAPAPDSPPDEAYAEEEVLF